MWKHAPRQIVQREEEPYSEIRVVHSGLLSQAVINRRLSKPLAMNLYAESSMMGFLNLFTGVQAPRLVTCEKRAKATVVNRQLVLAAVKTNSQFLLEFSAYCEIAAKSELIGILKSGCSFFMLRRCCEAALIRWRALQNI